MTSAEELFRRYAADYEAGKDPAVGDYAAQAEGADRAALELMIEHYLLRQAPASEVTEQDIERERTSARGQQIAELIAEPSVADLRRLREQQNLELDELAEKVLEAGAVSEPTAEEKEKAAGYLGQIEKDAFLRVSARVWRAINDALGSAIPQPSTTPAFTKAFRVQKGGKRLSAAEAEAADAFLYAYMMPSPRTWDRVDDLFLGDPDD